MQRVGPDAGLGGGGAAAVGLLGPIVAVIVAVGVTAGDADEVAAVAGAEAIVLAAVMVPEEVVEAGPDDVQAASASTASDIAPTPSTRLMAALRE